MNQLELQKKITKARQLMQAKQHAEALKVYAQLVKQFPDAGGEYGGAASIAGDFALADRVWKKFRETQPPSADFFTRLAGEYQNIGCFAQGRALFAEAVKQEPRNLALNLKYADLVVRTSDVPEARAVVQACLALDPHNEQARYLLIHLDRRENKWDDAERQLRDFISRGVKDRRTAISCHIELATILDRTNRFDEAMTELERGKTIAREGFSQKNDRSTFYEKHEREVSAAKAFPKDILRTWEKSFPPSARVKTNPVAFLTGSARSGTTLLEKILDAHPGIAAADETPALKTLQTNLDPSTTVLASQRLNPIRQRYIKNLSLELGEVGDGQLLIDKNPSRTVWLPAFLRAFPELKVLIALRDPRDVMMSLYFQDHHNTNYLTFEQLAVHYRDVMQVWLAVREWEGLHWLETKYEDVVANLKKEGARVTEFLGLAWHENQARYFEKNREKPVMSTNYTGVTAPVYNRSVGRWRAFEKYLAPALPILEPFCKEFGYS